MFADHILTEFYQADLVLVPSRDVCWACVCRVGVLVSDSFLSLSLSLFVCMSVCLYLSLLHIHLLM